MPALPKASALLTLAASCLHLLSAQSPVKTSHQHPLFPPTWIRLQATQPSAFHDNTVLIQSALDACVQGQAVELSPSTDSRNTTFLITPLTLPAGVTLLIDAGVTLYALPNPSKSPPLITVTPSTTNIPAGLMGFGILDARGNTVIEVRSPLDIFKLTIRNSPATLLQSASSAPLRIAETKLAGTILTPPAPNTIILNSTLTTTQIQCTLTSDLACTNPTLPQPSTELYATTADTTPTIDLTTTALIQLNAVVIPPDASTPVPPNALVVFYDGKQQLGTAPILNTLAQLSIPPLAPGSHHITAFYPAANLPFGSVNIIIPTLTIAATATTVYSRTPITFTANLSEPTATGTITFSDGATDLNQSPPNNGTASFTTSTLALGPHTISAAYSGDTLDNPAASPDLDIQVNSNPTITALAPITSGKPYGTPLTLTATIRPTDATGTIVFRDASTSTQLGTSTLASGTATLTYSGNLSVGTHTLTAAYTGDIDDLTSTSAPVSVTVTAIPTTTSLTAAPTTAPYGTPILLTGSVTPSASTGTITFTDTATGALSQLPLTGGTATFTTSAPLPPGPHTFTATYSGDATHATSLSPAASIQVNRLTTTTTLTGLPATFPAGTQPTLTATITPTPATGTITMSDANSGSLGTVTSANGIATFTLPILQPGPHTITAAYAGDTNDAPSTSPPATTQIAPAITTLTLTAPTTLPYGAPISITAAITPTTSTGTITLTESPSNATISALIANGTATLTLPTLPPGTHTLAGTYPGDSLNAKSSSPAATLTIVPATSTTTLTLAQTSIPAGTPVVVNVQISSVAAAIPSGQIVIRAQSPTGAVTLATTTLINASAGKAYATVTVDSIALGLGTFTNVMASYAGDADDSPSTSTPTSFTIVPTPVTATLTLSASQVPFATKPTLTATLASRTGTPTGSISFYQDGNLLQSLPATAGPLSVSLPSLPVGSYLFTAAYTPTGLFAPASPTPQLLAVTSQFALTLTPDTLNQATPSAGSSTLTITPLSGFSGPISATCTVPYPYFTCTIDAPPAIGNRTPSTASIHLTLAKNIVESARNTPPTGPHGNLEVLAILILPILYPLRRKLPRALALLAFTATVTFTACSPGTFFDIPLGANTLYVTVKTSTSSISTPLIVNVTK